MRKRPQAHRPSWPQPNLYRQTQPKRQGFISEYGPAFVGGAILVVSFAFAGHIIGKNAVAHNAEIGDTQFLPQTSNVLAKGSLLPNDISFDIVNLKVAREQSVDHTGKGDLDIVEVVDEVPPPISEPQQKKLVALAPGGIRIEPAALNIREDESEAKSAVKRLALTPKPSKIEKDFKLSTTEKQKVVTQRRVRLAEENCLARAVYFEARSESELGQMAVAKVILNRTRTEGFPKSICGVVYQGSSKRNSCQFSFACDGQPDDVTNAAAWSRSRQIAQKAIAGQGGPVNTAMKDAINYHADYVSPKWSKTMRRLVKIGRHVFYAGG